MSRVIGRSKSDWEWRRGRAGFKRGEEVIAERLREVLNYNPETGVFTWRVKPSQNTSVGDVTGCPQAGGYLGIVLGLRLYRAHRLAWLYMTGEWPKTDIDHINHVSSDNRWRNLREATDTQNSANARMRIDNASGFRGVKLAMFKSGNHKWRASINVNGKRKHLGNYDTPERAFIERVFAEWRHFGDFANPDADYLQVINERRALEKERRMLQTVVLYNLANPDYMKITV